MYAVEIWRQERGMERVSGCPTCEQKRTADKDKKEGKKLVTSLLSALAGGLSLKKAESYYFGF